MEKRVFCWKKSNTFLCMWPTEATTRQAFHVSNLVPCPQNMKKKKMHVLILTRHATFLSQNPYKWKTVHFNVLHMLHTTIQLKAFFPGAAQTRRDNAWAGFWLEGVGLVGSLHTRQPSFPRIIFFIFHEVLFSQKWFYNSYMISPVTISAKCLLGLSVKTLCLLLSRASERSD